jgi:hypothetical protein
MAITAASSAKSIWRLYYGNGTKPAASVAPDAHWPNMWRAQLADGQLSDLGNLSRIKDAAAVIAERGPPARDRLALHWKQQHLEKPREAPQARYSSTGAVLLSSAA